MGRKALLCCTAIEADGCGVGTNSPSAQSPGAVLATLVWFSVEQAVDEPCKSP